MELPEKDGKAEAQSQFFDFGFRQSEFLGFRKDAAYSGAPLFDQVQFLENPGDDRIADTGSALLHVFNGQTWQQNSHAFDFDAVIEKNDPDGSSALGKISVHTGIDDDLAQNSQWDAPDIAAAHLGEIRSAESMFFQKKDDFIDCLWEWGFNVDMIKNVEFSGAEETSALYPGIREMSCTLFSEKEDGAFGGHEPVLMGGQAILESRGPVHQACVHRQRLPAQS